MWAPGAGHTVNFEGDDSRGLSTDQEELWVRFPVGAGPSHTTNFKNGSDLCLHGTQDEVGTKKQLVGPVSV